MIARPLSGCSSAASALDSQSLKTCLHLVEITSNNKSNNGGMNSFDKTGGCSMHQASTMKLHRTCETIDQQTAGLQHPRDPNRAFASHP